MAYTIVIQDAFNKGANEEGWDYATAEDLIKRLQDISLGRFYMDEQGQATYESRFARNA